MAGRRLRQRFPSHHEAVASGGSRQNGSRTVTCGRSSLQSSARVRALRGYSKKERRAGAEGKKAAEEHRRHALSNETRCREEIQKIESKGTGWRVLSFYASDAALRGWVGRFQQDCPPRQGWIARNRPQRAGLTRQA